MKKNKFFSLILILYILFLNTLPLKAETIIPHIATAYINGVELKFRTNLEEKEYFKQNNQISMYSGYLGNIYKYGYEYMIPLKKTMELANVLYYIDNDGDIKLQNDHIVIKAKKESKYITIHNLATNKISKEKLSKDIKYIDNIYYVPLNIFKHLNFNYTIQQRNKFTSSDLIYINDNDSTTTHNFSKQEKDKYENIINLINKSRRDVNNNSQVTGFIRDNNLFAKMSKSNYNGKLKITIPKGDYLQNFYYGKILFLKNGELLGTAERKKEQEEISYYIFKNQEYFLEIADEIIIFCPYCESQKIIITKNPFKNCDCELN